MKAFIVSLAALVILAAAVTVNSVFICGRIDEIMSCAELLPELDPSADGARETSERLYALWDRTVEPLSYTVGYQLIDRADDAIEEIAAAIAAGTDGNYASARRRFIDSLKRMRKLQGLTFTGVF